MTELFVAIAAFIVSHAIAAVGPLRAALIRVMGRAVYMALYSIVSVAILVWLGLAFVNAPYVEIWQFREWTRWVTLVLMVPSVLLLVAGLSSPNPLSLSLAAADDFDPARPGIVGVTRHPVIWAIGLWALAHIPPNGDLAALSMFSLLLLSGLTGPKSLDAKRRARLGREQWFALAGNTSNIPFVALLRGRTSVKGLGLGPIVAGLALYGGLFFAHQWVIGVAPLP